MDMNRWELPVTDLQVCEKVGSGCTAEVFRGIYLPTGAEVAVKQIDWLKSHLKAQDVKAFDREIGIMPLVTHANLVRFVGVASIQKPFQIITEFCRGGCCFELLHNCDHIELEWNHQVKMCNDVAAAMGYLHAFNPQIIHRDLKSLNLLLSNPVLSGSDVPLVKVSDFGLSRMKDQTDWGKMTIAAGTCHWMAPEVHQGGNYDEKVDVYSYAMILFEVCCREIPFEDEEPAKVGGICIKGGRPDLEAVPPDCPDGLQDLMVDCWAQNPKARPDFPTILARLARVET